jgi:hypothetical protein
MRGTSISIEVRCFGCDKPSAEISIEHEEERAFNYVARQQLKIVETTCS